MPQCAVASLTPAIGGRLGNCAGASGEIFSAMETGERLGFNVAACRARSPATRSAPLDRRRHRHPWADLAGKAAAPLAAGFGLEPRPEAHRHQAPPWRAAYPLDRTARPCPGRAALAAFGRRSAASFATRFAARPAH